MIIFSFQIGGKVKSVSGSPGEVIIKVSKEENASIIVSGTRGMGTIRRTFLGSVSDYIIHHAHVPVLVARHPEQKHTDHHHK
jgi:nucleotide-binding universal stress UspA family protein